MSGDGGGGDGGSVTVLADAQFTPLRVLKPFPGFESVYQGRAGNVPIMFPGVRDIRSKKPAGFSANLAQGIPVPLGARLMLWIPMCFGPGEEGGNENYRYRLIWRMQNLNSYRDPGRTNLPRPPWHFPSQRPGAQSETVIPAGWRTVAFEQPEAAGADGQVNLRIEDLVVTTDDSPINLVPPVYADGTEAVLQQGILDTVSNPVGGPLPIFKPFWCDVEGDELIILVTREDPTLEWDFTDRDLPFANVYGTGNGAHTAFEELGIYMSTGTNP